MDYDIKISQDNDNTFEDVETTIYMFIETVITLVLVTVTTSILLQILDGSTHKILVVMPK